MDPRTTLARPDLADERLQGCVRAARYAPAVAFACRRGSTLLRTAPDEAAMADDQLLFGEIVDVLDAHDGWAWGQARRDGYVGYVRQADLARCEVSPAARVNALSTLVFAHPDFKSPVVEHLALNSFVSPGRSDGRFAQVEGLGWIFAGHLSPIGEVEADVAAVAERFVGAPYRWGGRQASGIDCSGLVQQALFACGRGCPRDADQQAAIGREVALADVRRGDLICWDGHIAMAVDADRLVHANSHAMAVVIEPAAVAIERIERAGVGRPKTCRRL